MSTETKRSISEPAGSARLCPKCGHTSVRRWGVHFDHERRCVNPSCGFSWDPDDYAVGGGNAETPETGSLTHKGLLWAAINKYAKACGGDPGSKIYGNTERQRAVSEIENLVYPPTTHPSARRTQ